MSFNSAFTISPSSIHYADLVEAYALRDSGTPNKIKEIKSGQLRDLTFFGSSSFQSDSDGLCINVPSGDSNYANITPLPVVSPSPLNTSVVIAFKPLANPLPSDHKGIFNYSDDSGPGWLGARTSYTNDPALEIIGGNVNATALIQNAQKGMTGGRLCFLFVRVSPSPPDVTFSLFSSFSGSFPSAAINQAWSRTPKYLRIGTTFATSATFAAKYYFVARYDCFFSDIECEHFVNNFFASVGDSTSSVQLADHRIYKGIARGFERGIV
jgi:hypothetical protein